MLNFSSDPPLENTRYALRLLRTPAKKKLHLIVTSDNLIGCWTHFFGGRTVPCTRPDCEACTAGTSSRWHGYLSAIDPDTSEHLLFECTASAAESFAVYRKRHETLRGCEFVADRVNPRPNARLRLKMKPADLAHINLPQPANLQAALCHIWGLPLCETQVLHDTPQAPAIEADGRHLPADLAPPANGNGHNHKSTREKHPCRT